MVVVVLPSCFVTSEKHLAVLQHAIAAESGELPAPILYRFWGVSKLNIYKQVYRPSDKLADTYAGCELDFPAAIPTQRATTILRCVMTKYRHLQK